MPPPAALPAEPPFVRHHRAASRHPRSWPASACPLRRGPFDAVRCRTAAKPDLPHNLFVRQEIWREPRALDCGPTKVPQFSIHRPANPCQVCCVERRQSSSFGPQGRSHTGARVLPPFTAKRGRPVKRPAFKAARQGRAAPNRGGRQSLVGCDASIHSNYPTLCPAPAALNPRRARPSSGTAVP